LRNRKLNRKCKKCNIGIDDRGASGLCVKCSRQGKMNNFYGKHHSLSTRIKMKESSKKRNRSSYYKIPATKEIIKKRELTKKKNWDKLSTEEKHKRLYKFIKAGKKKKGTKIEKTIEKVLDDIGMVKNIDYKTNVYIGGFNVDFLIHDEFIVECYGDYWHKNPNQYNEEKDILKRNKDIERKEFLENLGYEFISFWETDIINNLDLVESKLTKFFRSYINLFEWESC